MSLSCGDADSGNVRIGVCAMSYSAPNGDAPATETGLLIDASALSIEFALWRYACGVADNDGDSSDADAEADAEAAAAGVSETHEVAAS